MEQLKIIDEILSLLKAKNSIPYNDLYSKCFEIKDVTPSQFKASVKLLVERKFVNYDDGTYDDFREIVLSGDGEQMLNEYGSYGIYAKSLSPTLLSRFKKWSENNVIVVVLICLVSVIGTIAAVNGNMTSIFHWKSGEKDANNDTLPALHGGIPVKNPPPEGTVMQPDKVIVTTAVATESCYSVKSLNPATYSKGDIIFDDLFHFYNCKSTFVTMSFHGTFTAINRGSTQGQEALHLDFYRVFSPSEVKQNGGAASIKIAEWDSHVDFAGNKTVDASGNFYINVNNPGIRIQVVLVTAYTSVYSDNEAGLKNQIILNGGSVSLRAK
ncbi:MAG TPA: hypothetical protein VN922_01640 [Bacteroidia bacterium]|nr:hypothetical protein [Bacteroidia bacterium]